MKFWGILLVGVNVQDQKDFSPGGTHGGQIYGKFAVMSKIGYFQDQKGAIEG